MGTIKGVVILCGAHTIAYGTTTYPNWRITSATEDYSKIPAPKCQLGFFGLYVQTNTLNGSTTVQLRKNGADVSGESITIAAGVTGLQTKACSVLLEDGDEIDYCITTAGTSGSIATRGGGGFFE